MSESVFRKKSLDKIQSPENLNDYVRVTRPAVWLLLLGIIALLAGVCVWGVFGRIETRLAVTAEVQSGVAICELAEADMGKAENGMAVYIGRARSEIIALDLEKMTVTAAFDLPDGKYSAQIVTESIQPLSFVFN